MVRMLISALVFLASAAIGLLVSMLVLDGMHIEFGSFVLVVVIFAVLQAVLGPFLAKLAHRNVPALLGAVGLITTFVALLIAWAVTSGLRISGIDTWVFASLITWAVTMLATLFLPLILGKRAVQRGRERRDAGA